MWSIGILIVAVIALGVYAARGRLGQLGPDVPDRPGPDLGDGPLTGSELREVHFAVVTRGYEMGQVDAVMARLASQLEAAASLHGALRTDAVGSSTSRGGTPDSASPRQLGDNGGTGVSDGVHDDEKRGSNGSNEAPNR
ncbi:MAG: DivIVA domain-containing protein [Propionibacterium sp.]